jgi:hypothetical protein
MLLRRTGSEKAEGRQNALASHFTADPTMVGGDANRCQPESGGGYTGHSHVSLLVFNGPSISKGAVGHQARARIRLLQEVPKGAPGNIVQKVNINPAERLRRRAKRRGI